VKALADLVGIFLEPMMHQDIDSILTPAELKSFYPECLPSIVDVHTKLLIQLKARTKVRILLSPLCRRPSVLTPPRLPKSWAETKAIADIFHSILSTALPYFKSYATNIDACFDLLKRVVHHTREAETSPETPAANPNPTSNAVLFQKVPLLQFLSARNAKRSHRQSVNSNMGSNAPNRASVAPQSAGLASVLATGGLVAGSMTEMVGSGQYMEAVNDFAMLLIAPLARIARYTRLVRDLLQFTPKCTPVDNQLVFTNVDIYPLFLIFCSSS